MIIGSYETPLATTSYHCHDGPFRFSWLFENFLCALPPGTLLFRDVNNKGKSAGIREDPAFYWSSLIG
jgi:hypothetical protein